jgi:hypothetical protein
LPSAGNEAQGQVGDKTSTIRSLHASWDYQLPRVSEHGHRSSYCMVYDECCFMLSVVCRQVGSAHRSSSLKRRAADHADRLRSLACFRRERRHKSTRSDNINALHMQNADPTLSMHKRTPEHASERVTGLCHHAFGHERIADERFRRRRHARDDPATPHRFKTPEHPRRPAPSER